MRTFTLLALLLTACSTDSFENPDTGTTDDGGSDAPSDALPIDAPTEASGDAISVDANPLFSCTSPPAGSIFCADFDGVTLVNKGWTSPFISNGGLIELDTANFKSAPQSMRSTIPAGANGFVQAALFYEDANSTFQTMTARAAVRVTSIDASQSIQILRLNYTGTGAQLSLYGGHVVLDYTNSAVDGGMSSVELGAFVAGQWFDVELDMKQGPSAKLTATFNGTITTVSPQLPTPSSNVRDVELGISGVGSNSGDMIVNFDNFDYAGL